MKLLKTNTVSISGNVAHVDLKQGTHGPYGNLLIIVDDGYFQKGQNGNADSWIERSYPIGVKVNSNIIKQAGQAGFNKGDYIAVEGKNVVEFGKGPNGEPDQNKKFPKVEAKGLLQHFTGHIAKQIREDIKAEKQQGNQQQSNSNGGYQNQNNGGYQQQGNNQQNPSQNGGGGYSQQGNNPHNQNGGGYQQQQNHYNNQQGPH